MAFTGNLNAVAIADVVQLVGLAQRSGTLTVVTGRGRITVLFRNGHVVDASAVRFARPDGGGGSQSQAKELHIRANLTGDPSKGVSLAEMAGKIFRLGSGHFNFQAGEPQTDSQIALDVSGLLLESFRLQDEATRDGAVTANEYESLPDEVPEGEAVVETAPAAQPKTSPLLHLFTLFKSISAGRTEHDYERVVLEAAREVFDRAILFRVAEEELCGVGGYHGTRHDGTPELLAAALAAIKIPRGVQSPMQDAVEVKHISVGEASDEWWRGYIPGEFGPPPDTEYVAVPVVAGETCVMVLYGDTYTHREFADPLRALEVICKYVGALTENEMLRSQKQVSHKSWRERLFGASPSV
jgi:hypothetical protein